MHVIVFPFEMAKEDSKESKSSTKSSTKPDTKPDTKPADWEFMKQSGEVLENIPSTWMEYPYTERGIMGIIDMEYNEFKDAEAKGKTLEERSKELVHLASACLYLWRKINNVSI